MMHAAKGPDRWVYRWWDSRGPKGDRVHRSKVIGSVTRFPTLAKAKQAVENFRSEINAVEEKTLAVMTVGEAWAHFQANELRDPNVDRSPSTIQSYLDYFKAHIIPKWGDVPLDGVKSVAVERWLRGLMKSPAPPPKAAVGETKPAPPKEMASQPLAPGVEGEDSQPHERPVFPLHPPRTLQQAESHCTGPSERRPPTRPRHFDAGRNALHH
jgi:hypothetical protein